MAISNQGFQYGLTVVTEASMLSARSAPESLQSEPAQLSSPSRSITPCDTSTSLSSISPTSLGRSSSSSESLSPTDAARCTGMFAVLGLEHPSPIRPEHLQLHVVQDLLVDLSFGDTYPPQRDERFHVNARPRQDGPLESSSSCVHQALDLLYGTRPARQRQRPEVRKRRASPFRQFPIGIKGGITFRKKSTNGAMSHRPYIQSSSA